MGVTRNIRAEIEAEYGAPIVDVLRALAADGWEQNEVAARYGITTACVRRWGRGAGIKWPCPKARLASLEKGKALSEHRTEYRGEQRTLAEIARMSGVLYTTVCARYQRGDRGAALGRKVTRSTKQPRFYELGYSMTEWQDILDLAEIKGTEAVRQCFGVPRGAITAAQRGEWFRLA